MRMQRKHLKHPVKLSTGATQKTLYSLLKVEPAQFTAIEVYDLLIKAGCERQIKTTSRYTVCPKFFVYILYQISTLLFMFFVVE